MIVRLLSGFVCFHLVVGSASSGEVPEHNPPEWIDEVQTYCMMPILPESAVDLGISVNGGESVQTTRDTITAVE